MANALTHHTLTGELGSTRHHECGHLWTFAWLRECVLCGYEVEFTCHIDTIPEKTLHVPERMAMAHVCVQESRIQWHYGASYTAKTCLLALFAATFVDYREFGEVWVACICNARYVVVLDGVWYTMLVVVLVMEWERGDVAARRLVWRICSCMCLFG